MFENIPPDVKTIAPGAVGAGLALRWLPGSFWTKTSFFLGGCAAAWYGTVPAAEYFGWPEKAYGLMGLLIGMFSMMGASRILEGLKNVDLAKHFNDVADLVKKRFGGG